MPQVTRYAIQHDDGSWLSSKRFSYERGKLNGRSSDPAFARLFSKPHYAFACSMDPRTGLLNPGDRLVEVIVTFP